MKRVAILGSTGSIGTQTLDVISRHPDRFQVVGLAARRNAALLQEQARRFDVRRLALYEPTAGVPSGMEAVVDVATAPDVDLVVVCVAGVIGLLPTVRAIEAGKAVALASKEVLVAAGEIVMPLAKQHGVEIVPIDSEHCAVFQCLRGYRPDQVRKLILTASGGPFRGRKTADLADVTVEQALNHPTWRMGGKITVDSATLMNKGLETIEAKWLFGLSIDQVEVQIHPQSVVHSLVVMRDGSALGQLGWPDMRLPIFVALSHPERVESGLPPWSPLDTPNLTFEGVDEQTFRCLPLARESARIGGTMPCAMNAANEEAANAFLAGKARFLQIPETVETVMVRHHSVAATLESLIEADREARELARESLLSGSRA